MIITEEWQKAHGMIINDFMNVLSGNNDNEFILKGGTALMLCYGLDRFSEDIDLDKNKGSGSLLKIIDHFCCARGYESRIAKNTNTTQRVMIKYSEDDRQKPLKIEMSMRRGRAIPAEEITTKNGIVTYIPDVLTDMKIEAYLGRDAIRDLYDLCYLYNNYKGEILDRTFSRIERALSVKGLEQFDYLIHTQQDELINNDQLMQNFLTMYDDLGLRYDNDETKVVEMIKKNETP